MRTESYEISFPFFKKENKKVDIPPLRKTEGKKKKKKTREIVTTKEEDEETESSLSLGVRTTQPCTSASFFGELPIADDWYTCAAMRHPKRFAGVSTARLIIEQKDANHHLTPLFSFFLEEEVTNRTFMRVRL